MGYRLRDERAGHHHVVARGNNKQPIFLTDDERSRFLQLLNRVAKKHRWEVLAYCLMRNHYHLVVRVESDGLARGLCELNGAYALWFNQQHGRINHLFGKRYWNEHLADDRRLLNVIRYVIQNPQRAGLGGPFEAHVWTSYRATIGATLSFGQFRRDEVLALFGTSPADAVARFVAFCAAPSPDDRAPPSRAPRQPP